MRTILGEKIVYLKYALRMTDKELGGRFGVSAQNINNIINQDKTCPSGLIYAFVRLGVNVNGLIDDNVSLSEYKAIWNYTVIMNEIKRLKNELIDKQHLLDAATFMLKKRNGEI